MQISKFLYIALLVSITIICKSQDFNAIFILETDAEYYMAEGDFNKAADSYLKALKKYPESANLMFKAGFCFLKTDDKKEEALYYLEEAAKRVSDSYDEKSLKETGAPPEVLYNLGVAYLIGLNFEKAATAFTEFKKYIKPKDTELMQLVDQNISNCANAKSFINNPISINLKNLGELINTDDSNTNPVISGDGKTLAYTTRTSTGNKIFVSKYENDAWSKPIDITRFLGNKFLKTACLAYEGQELYLVEEDYKNSEILVSSLQKNKWTKAAKAAKPINSKYNESHICVSRDGNTIYFSSDRKGGQGGYDIYKSTLIGDAWSEPVNLGPNINTPLNDDAPLLTPDEKYLFFSSEGHNSIGGYDIFYVNLEGTSNVKNIGYPINTPEDNMFFQPTGLNSGFYSFYSKDGLGGQDIYAVDIIPYVDLKINIMLAENAPTDKNYTCIITNKTNNAVIDSQTGKGIKQFVQKVTPGNYAVSIHGENFQMAENAVEIPSNPTQSEYSVSVVLNSVKKEEPLVVVADVTDIKKQTETQKTSETKSESVVSIADNESKQKEAQQATDTDATKKRDTGKSKPKEVKPTEPALDFKKVNVSNSRIPTSYSVQVLAVTQPADINFISKYDSVYVTISLEGFYRYSVGNTKSIQESEDILAKLKATGTESAFVRINSEHPGYTIQIMALTSPKKISQFSEINDLMVYRGSDGLYRYCVGKYASPEEAQDDIAKLAAIGYSKVFVRELGK